MNFIDDNTRKESGADPAEQARRLQKGVADLCEQLQHSMDAALGHAKKSDLDHGSSGSRGGPSA